MAGRIRCPECDERIPASAQSEGNPSTASPFFAVGGVWNPNDSLSAYDIRTKQQAGVIRGKTDLQPPVAPSPDGKYLAGKSGFKSVVDVYDFTTGKGVRSFDPHNHLAPVGRFRLQQR